MRSRSSIRPSHCRSHCSASTNRSASTALARTALAGTDFLGTDFLGTDFLGRATHQGWPLIVVALKSVEPHRLTAQGARFFGGRRQRSFVVRSERGRPQVRKKHRVQPHPPRLFRFSGHTKKSTERSRIDDRFFSFRRMNSGIRGDSSSGTPSTDELSLPNVSYPPHPSHPSNGSHPSNPPHTSNGFHPPHPSL